MKAVRLELEGRVFGRLTVVSFSHAKGNAYWNCQCSCGNNKIIVGRDLMSGHTKSCGCIRKENTKTMRTKHGLFGTNIYWSWAGIIARCLDKNNPNYKNYGERGIKVCDRWRDSFENFLEDMGERPKGTSIDRIDNNGNYCKENCKWSTNIEQANNTRTNRYITINGETMTAANWARELKMDYHKFYRKYVLKQNVAM